MSDLTVGEAARYCGCSRATIYHRVNKGLLPDRRNEVGCLVFSTKDLDKFPTDHSRGPKTGTAHPKKTRAAQTELQIFRELPQQIAGFQYLAEFEEVTPITRCWAMVTQTDHGLEQWLAIEIQGMILCQRLKSENDNHSQS